MSRLEVLSSDEDDSDMSPAEAYKKDLIRKRKTDREVTRLQRDANAKDAVQPPKKDILVGRQLSSDTDYLAVLMFLMIVEERVRPKVWSVAVESWAFLQFVPGSDAHTSFHNNLKNLSTHHETKCFFPSYDGFKAAILAIFFSDHTCPIAVIEKYLPKIRMSPHGKDSPAAPKTAVAFMNILKFLFMQAPPHLSYPEVHQVQRIRSMLPKTVEDFLRDHEIGHPGGGLLASYDALLPVLRRQDELFKREMAGKAAASSSKGAPPNAPSSKRNDADARIQSADAEGGAKRRGNPNKLDNRPLCSHCNKSGHLAASCWEKYPEKKREFHAKGKASLQSADAVTPAAFAALVNSVQAIQTQLSAKNSNN